MKLKIMQVSLGIIIGISVFLFQFITYFIVADGSNDEVLEADNSVRYITHSLREMDVIVDTEVYYNKKHEDTIPTRLYKKLYFDKAEVFFNLMKYENASEYYNEYLHSLSYSDKSAYHEQFKIAENRKLACDLFLVNLELNNLTNLLPPNKPE